MTFADLLTFLGAMANTILATSAVANAVMALVLLWLYYRVTPEQPWIQYLGYAYLVYFFQYLASWLAHQFAPAAQNAALTMTAQAAGLATYSILLFMTARALLAISRKQLFIIAISSILSAISGPLLPETWGRVPGSAIAVVCILALGHAFSVNLDSIGSPRLGRLAMAICLAYATLYLTYAAIPLVASFDLRLNSVVAASAERAKGVFPGGVPDISYIYDSGVFTVALFLRLAIFATGLTLITRSLFMLSAAAYRGMLRRVVDGMAEYLASDGVVKAVGESFRADLSEICMRAPGSKKRMAVWWRWLDQASDGVRTIEVTELPSAEKSVVGRVLAEGKKVFSVDWTSDPEIKGRYLVNAPGMKTLVTVPILYHRSTVGVLNLEWKKKLTVNEATLVLRQAQTVADYLAPVVQYQRQLSALDRFSAKLPWSEMSNWGNKNTVLRQVKVVHETMSVLATGIGLKVGFRAVWAACSDNRRIPDTVLSNSDINIDAFVGSEVAELAKDGGLRQEDVQVWNTRLRIIAPEAEPLNVGTLRLAYAAPGAPTFDASKAPLGSNYIFRRTVAALVAYALVDSVRMELSAALSELQTRLQSKELYSVENWVSEIEMGLLETGLLWVVAATEGRRRLLGRPEPVSAIEELLENGNREADQETEFAVHELDPSRASAHHAISLHLPVAGAHLWVGVSRKGFGHELDWNSPWRVFLERVRESANTALLRIVSTMEFEKLALEQARTQGLMTTLVTLGTITHQLSNFASGMSGSVAVLDEAIRLGRMKTDADTEETVRAMKESTARLRSLLEPLSTITVVDERRPCDLREAIKEAEKLHSFSLRERNVAFRRPADGKPMVIDIPFHVATLALANLISNSLDAIGRNGTIEITTEENDDVLTCHVKDDGPGLPISNPFDLGVTTKERSGGWGLYLTKRSLRENQSEIEATDPGPGGTVFTLRFPKPKN